MAKHSKRNGPQQRKFATAAKACHAKVKPSGFESHKAYSKAVGKCMKEKL